MEFAQENPFDSYGFTAEIRQLFAENTESYQKISVDAHKTFKDAAPCVYADVSNVILQHLRREDIFLSFAPKSVSPKISKRRSYLRRKWK